MERTVHVKRPGLEPLKVKVRIWNDTVSNLTLMALGKFSTNSYRIQLVLYIGCAMVHISIVIYTLIHSACHSINTGNRETMN